MTKSENVNKVVLELSKQQDLDPNSKSYAKKEFVGVATRKQIQDDLRKVTILVDALYDILKIYGYNDKNTKFPKGNAYHDLHVQKVKDQKNKTINDKLKLRNKYLEFVFSSGHGSWKDLFKYKINAFFSYVMEQEVPPHPKGLENHQELLDPSFLYYGRAKRFLKKMFLNRETIESFAQTVAQSKKGAPPVSEEMVADAEYKCFVHLTSEHKDIPDFEICDKDNFYHPINRNTMTYQLRRTIREIFSGKVPEWDELTKPFVPSTSSQYNWSRNCLGGVGAFCGNERITQIVKEFWEMKFLHCDEGNRNKLLYDLVKKTLGPVKLSKELTTLYGKAGVEDQERINNDLENIIIKDTIGLHFDGSELCKFWRELIYPAMIIEALQEDPRTVVIGLPEPLKVRCITAGPPITYAVLKPMQKWLWRNLKDLNVFQLIGRPVSPEIVKEQLGRLGLDEEFISGDYKASTDNLHSWVSETLLDELRIIWEAERKKDPSKNEFLQGKNLEDFIVLMKRALTGHDILDASLNETYQMGKYDLRDEDFHPQKEGQLMGSIISFPFLCLANAAMCRWAMEITDCENYQLINKPIKGYKKCRLLVNGDDCVFPGKTTTMFDNWKKVTAFGGLESSVGKTFRSRKFLTINSVQYKYRGDGWEEDLEYIEIKYVNLGLVYAQKKDGIRGKPFYRLGAIHRDLHRTCPPEYFQTASKLFLKEARRRRFRTYWNKQDKCLVEEEIPFSSILDAQVPYYMPEWLGGLGLVRTEKSQINDWDLRVAGFIRSNYSESKIQSISETPKWAFHKLAQKSIDDYAFLGDQNFQKVEFDGTERDLEEEYDKLYGLLVVEALLTTELDKLTLHVQETEENKMLRRKHLQNQHIWRKLRSDPAFGGLIAKQKLPEYEDLIPERKAFSLSCFDVRK